MVLQAPFISTTDYEAEKAHLIDGFKKRPSSSIAPSGAFESHVDWGNFASYAYYYEEQMDAGAYLRDWRSSFTAQLAKSSVEALAGSKPASVIISPFAFQDESRVWEDSTGPASLANTLWSDTNIRDLLIKPATDQGVKKIILWMDWIPYFADRAIRTPTGQKSDGNPNWTRTSSGHPVVGDSEVYFRARYSMT